MYSQAMDTEEVMIMEQEEGGVEVTDTEQRVGSNLEVEPEDSKSKPEVSIAVCADNVEMRW